MKISILFSGQWRTNDTCLYNRANSKPQININIMNIIKAFEDLGHIVDIFISTDDLHLSDTNKQFGTRIKNIYLANTGFFMKKLSDEKNFVQETDIKKQLKLYYGYMDNMIKTTLIKDYGYADGYWPYDKAIYQYMKLYIAYMLMDDYSKINNIQYDICLRIRPDSLIKFNFTNDMLLDIYNEKYVVATADTFICCSLRLMKLYASVVKTYGQNSGFYYFWKKSDILRWAFAPETQVYGIYDSINNRILYSYYLSDKNIITVQLIR